MATIARDIFKAYDIRGRVPDELDERLARRIGVALAAQLGALAPWSWAVTCA